MKVVVDEDKCVAAGQCVAGSTGTGTTSSTTGFIHERVQLRRRVAVVTGAGRGIGRAHARLSAERGAKVVVNDPGGSMEGDGSDTGPAQSVVEEIATAGGEAVADTNDVATQAGATCPPT
ncbi:short chain dehydrogenase [Streptomyces sp. MnatMP-M17]|nr:short chain dehydrogenase [Streptomyces sp. MnatMP-M17]